jgi:hypothetical protein
MLERIKGLERLKEADSGGPAVDRKKIESRLKQWIQVKYPSLRTQACCTEFDITFPIRLRFTARYLSLPSLMPWNSSVHLNAAGLTHS